VTGDGGPGCVASPTNTNSDIINACSNAQAIDKTVTIPESDGGLEPLP
jgi:hypothetical protein